MVTLRQMELHEGLSHYTEGAVKDAFRHIVGVQFRNLTQQSEEVCSADLDSQMLTLLLSLDVMWSFTKEESCPFRSLRNLKETMTFWFTL